MAFQPLFIRGWKQLSAYTCLSYAECSRKSLACKMYVIVNKQVKFLTSQVSTQIRA